MSAFDSKVMEKVVNTIGIDKIIEEMRPEIIKEIKKQLMICIKDYDYSDIIYTVMDVKSIKKQLEAVIIEAIGSKISDQTKGKKK